MLGQDVVAEAQARGLEVIGLRANDLDLRDPVAVARIGAGEWPEVDWCINCAAYTAVDKAESEADAAAELNTLGPGYLATACTMAGIRLLHVSTDFVFDGEATEPYLEDHPTNPLGVYGRTKRDGEEAVRSGSSSAVIVRTSWLYGPGGQSFPRTMIRAWLAGRELRVVADQTGCPTYTADLARVLIDLLQRDPLPGIYHACGPDAMTWRDFAEQAIFAYRNLVLQTDQEVRVASIRTEDWPTPARRPKYSVLNCQKLYGLGIPPMKSTPEAVREFVRRLPPDL